NLNLEDWKNILEKISDDFPSLALHFFPFCWKFLGIDLIGYFINQQHFSLEIKDQIRNEYKERYHWLVVRKWTDLDSMEEFNLKWEQFEEIHERLIMEGAKRANRVFQDW
ncbi:MAG: hypothetical protein H7Y04_04160, partial [Verrucomicrobia bacterium]|nr:hypothetical protein [Cytophagales bacterium]